MKKFIGKTMRAIGIIGYIVFGIWGLLISISILNYIGGYFLVVLGFSFFPVTLMAAPWYAVIKHNTFYPLMVIYGGGLLAAFLFSFGAYLEE